MSQSNKMPGVFIFLLIVILFLFLILPLFRIGLHNLGIPAGEGFFLGPLTVFRGPAMVFIPIVIITLIWLLISIWVYNDAERNGMSGILWALLVFFGNLIALIIYLIVRSSATTTTPGVVPNAKTCPQCNSPIQSDFVVCPNCGTNLRNTCPKCQKNVQKGWKVCPYCGESLQ
ncbi:zinc ribbon domain-containing protein [candidate division KSB1 bacterium]|nr:zinc ribbon domain-containing protein [candidate division KSB1 bacterium]RQW06857.1 MAG: zinc ribbon domain-containing protein [candidate division KSB1 bacterium]